MQESYAHLDRFLTAVYRRLMVVRGLERVGICLALGCGGTLPLVVILLWRRQSALAVGLVTSIISVAAGLILAISRNPSRLDAAMEVDKQLRWADLLSTAWTIRRNAATSTNPWETTVLTMAEAQCATASPRTVLMHRWGSRAWGGVGLASALVLSLVFLTTITDPTQADHKERQFLNLQQHIFDSKITSLPGSPDWTDTANRHRLRTSDMSDSPESPNSSDFAALQAKIDNPYSVDPDGTHKKSDGTVSEHGGPGAAITPMPPKQLTIPPNLDPGHVASDSQPSFNANDAHPFGGVSIGANKLPSHQTTDQSTGMSGMSDISSQTNVTPWKNDTWRQDSQRATDAIQSGRIPDQYHELIKKYFDKK